METREPIKSMCGTRETLNMGILGSDQGESPFARPIHHHREDVFWPQLVDDLAQETTNEWHCFVLTRAICGFRLFDASADASNDFLSHCILARIAACTDKKRVLFGPHDVDCDSAHSATTLSLPVVVFEMLGSM
jgi:hypothetical protein